MTKVPLKLSVPPISIRSVTHDSRAFFVVRDDIVQGGTKTRVLSKIVPTIEQEGIVYPAHPYGYGAEALAVACNAFGYKLMLLYPNYSEPMSAKDYGDLSDELKEQVQHIVDSDMPRPMRRAVTMPNVTYFVRNDQGEQEDLNSLAEQFAKAHDYFHMPIGFDYAPFFNELVELIKSVEDISQFEEVWVVAGSGLMARALDAALPNADIKAVNLNMRHCNIKGIENYEAEEKVNQEAIESPPYPSARYYDAKLWTHVLEHGSPGALIWNVGG